MDDLIPYDDLLLVMTPSAVRHALTTGQLHRVERGLYTRAASVDQALRARGLQRRVPSALAAYESAAAFLGFAETPADLVVAVPHARVLARAPGLVVHRSRRDLEVTVVDGVRCTTVVQTVLDLARWCREPDALAHADAAVHAGLVTPTQLRAASWQLALLDGAPRARRVLDACAEGAESPAESRTRWALLDGGLPTPVLQHRVRVSFGWVRIDISWPDLKVCVEYDGWEAHRDRRRFASDRRRWRALTAAGWDVHPVTAADLHDPRAMAAEIGASLRRRQLAA